VPVFGHRQPHERRRQPAELALEHANSRPPSKPKSCTASPVTINGVQVERRGWVDGPIAGGPHPAAAPLLLRDEVVCNVDDRR
jgi:hypothetical protein